ncbi:METTL5 family protein [Halobacteria archaeon AArc-curdl1]|uniref:METTL5 family protein n=1 Tax=Natronosalvus hydrolyticus TaxID=2979988 RepID=A0AAP2ZA45_9EURY|nr:METTL5 family protein [Halobacteria archaeon AArc-curdl1]
MTRGPARRTLERQLESVADFSDPRAPLEQYLTTPTIAAHIAHLAAMHDDVAGTTVIDLGTGTGMLALAIGQYGPERVIGLDIDRAALQTARANEHRVRAALEDNGKKGPHANADRTQPNYEWVQADVRTLPLCLESSRWDRTESTRKRSTSSAVTIDTDQAPVVVVSNPPFGAQRGNRHADRPFLEEASVLADVSYTIHNAGSQEFVESFATDHGGTVTHAFQAILEVGHRFEFHDDEQADLETEVYRIKWDQAQNSAVAR